MGWEEMLNCVCQNAPQRPGVQEILDTLQRSTVCTGTQCFETEADAFGLANTPCANQGSNLMFMMTIMFMMMVAVMMQLKRRAAAPALTNKPGSSSGHANQPPPPAL